MIGRRTASLSVLLCLALCACSPASPSVAAGCVNDGFRTGFSAGLPDCRAYELVTPPDTNGRLVEAIGTYGFGTPFDLFPSELASPEGGSIVFMTYSSPLESPKEPTGVFDLYEASRSDSGWQTSRRLTPNGSQSVNPILGGVTSDHRYTFLDVNTVFGIPSGSMGGGGGTTTYLGKPDGSFELIGKGSEGAEPQAQGRFISTGGKHVIFSTGHSPEESIWCASLASCKVLRLEPDAPVSGTGVVYDREADGETQVVSLLPPNQTPAAGEDATYQGSSKDGTKVAFKIGSVLYVRVDGQKTEEVTGGDPTFAGLSANGRFLFYVTGGDIHRFDTASEETDDVNSSSDAEIVNISADGSHVYFVSPTLLDGPKGTPGAPNLYVWAGGAPAYVTTVAPSDLERTSGTISENPALTRWTTQAVAPVTNVLLGPGADSSRTTPDGTVLVFESRARLTPYDNAGHTEIYRFDDTEKKLECVSCNEAAEPATGDASLQDLELANAAIVIHNLSDDGRRVFFESTEALVSGDTDGVNDIYEWQQNSEDETSIALISSGRSQAYLPLYNSPQLPSSNVLFSVSPSGGDVVFLSQDALVAGAGTQGTPAIYDARVGGGFPEAPPAAPCLEEDCRVAELSASPPSGSPSSESVAGKGNVRARRHRCVRRGAKHEKHGHCPKKRTKKHMAKTSSLNGETPPAIVEKAGAVEDPFAHRGAASPAQDAADGVAMTAAAGEFAKFGIEAVGAETSTAKAAMHPDFITKFSMNHTIDKFGHPLAAARVENISISLPPGLLGNPTATPQCTTGELLAFANCPIDSQVGIAKALVEGFGEMTEPIYNLAPPHPDREVARFGFIAALYPVFIDARVRTSGDFGVTATVHDSPGLGALVQAKTTLWANPAESSHDPERLTAFEAIECPTGTACEAPGGKRSSGIPLEDRKAFFTNPTRCQEGQVGFGVTSYQIPGQIFTASAPLAPITDCTGLPFAPTFEADPTSHVAGAPTGLKTKLTIPQHLGEEERATATMREARVTLPEGMQVAAGAANWIGTCSEQQVGYHEEVDTNCPDNAKLGTATIVSPALSVPIEGTIYQRAPQPGHQLGLWLTADALGMHIKLPGSLEPDKTTGRLTAVFTDLPQVPVEEIDLNVWGGPRAPLQNPDHCGTFTTDFSFSPHSNDPAATGQSQMQITEGCNQGFDPTLHAGVTEPVAGKFSPFVFDLTRPDGNQALRGFSLHLPDGELAKIKGVPLCPDAAASSASCPQGSRIGSLTATTGPGPDPFTLPDPGKAQPQIYLAGPYEGSPFSIVSEVPAQAGPFDLGVLAVRSGLTVEPETGRAVVKADPLPQFFEGVGIAYRNLHAVVDRPEFNLNPTDCREMAVTADATSTQGTVAHPAARFQVDGCKALKFKPKLTLKLKGGTKRAQYPALTAILRARKGDANIAKASVALPHSEFLAQEHIGTICTRVQFAADKCPRKSVYGKAKAITPLLDKPLSGPVYLRSSNHPLPDLVAKLGGQLEIDLVGRIDSVHGGIRTTFESVPDAPVSKFVLQMKGGAKGLLTNSTDICRGAHKATVAMKAQNGRAVRLRPGLAASGCAHKKLGKHKKHH